MGELLIRRRTLIQPSGESSPLVYELYNRAFDRESIDTGIKFLADDFTGTILLDMTVTTNYISGDGRTARYLYVYNTDMARAEFQYGKSTASSSVLTVWWGDATVGLNTTYPDAERKRIAVTHEAGSSTINLKYKRNTKAVQSKSITSAAFTSTNKNNLLFGGPSAYALPVGTISSALIYNKILSTAEINAFFA